MASLLLILGVLLATLPHMHCTPSIHNVFADTIKAFANDSLLELELHDIAHHARQLAVKQAANTSDIPEAQQLAQHLRRNTYNTSYANFIQASKALVELAGVVSKHNPILVVLARRVFLSDLTLQWMAHNRTSLELQDDGGLSDIVAKLYQLHTSAVESKGLIEYLHISKSGGTSFSVAARLNRCDMPTGIGQLEELGDLPHWVDGSAFEEVTGGSNIMWSFYGDPGRGAVAQTCDHRAALVRSRGFTYVSNEYTLHGGFQGTQRTHVCPQSVNVVTLRHPAERLVSHLHYMLARVKRRVRGSAVTVSSVRVLAHSGKADGDGNSSRTTSQFHQLFCSGNVTVWEKVAPMVIDNYVTRSFLGERGFHSPAGSLGAPQLDVARRLLLQFDLVLDLGAGDGPASLIMEQGLGWNATLSQVHVRTADELQKLNYTAEECPNEELLARVLPRQWLDLSLYSTGRVVSFLDHLLVVLARHQGLQPTFSEGEAAGRVADPAFCGLLQSSGSISGRAVRERLMSSRPVLGRKAGGRERRAAAKTAARRMRQRDH